MTQPQNTACQNRPQLFLLKAALLETSLVDLVVESALRKLEKRIDFIESHAELILRVADGFDERSDMAIAFQLHLLILEDLLKFSKGVLIVAADFPEQIFLLGLLVFEIAKSFDDVLLQNVVSIQKLLVVSIEL
jgi:hypothetical protein